MSLSDRPYICFYWTLAIFEFFSGRGGSGKGGARTAPTEIECSPDPGFFSKPPLC